jgi:hypothetical protein
MLIFENIGSERPDVHGLQPPVVADLLDIFDHIADRRHGAFVITASRPAGRADLVLIWKHRRKP